MVDYKEWYTYNEGTAKCNIKKYYNFRKLFATSTKD